MVAINKLSLSGKVASLPKRIASPSGIEHCQFILEHCSNVNEAGFNRQVWCKISVQISGDKLIEQTRNITLGVELLIRGFLVSQRGINQTSQLVFHAEQIEFIGE